MNVEVRINSADDARSAVHHSPDIVAKVLAEKDGLIFRIAKECEAEARPILAGNFPCMVNYRIVPSATEHDARVLYQLPHWVPVADAPKQEPPKVVESAPVIIPVQAAPIVAVRRRPGRPRKVTADASLASCV